MLAHELHELVLRCTIPKYLLGAEGVPCQPNLFHDDFDSCSSSCFFQTPDHSYSASKEPKAEHNRCASFRDGGRCPHATQGFVKASGASAVRASDWGV